MFFKSGEMICILISISCFLGCSTYSAINKGVARISYDDGINADEAKLIAKKNLVETPFLGWAGFRIIAPSILNNVDTRKYPQYWFVFFHPNMVIRREGGYLIVVDKRNGEIKRDIPFNLKYDSLINVLNK